MQQEQITTNASPATIGQKWGKCVINGRTFITERRKGEEGSLQIAEVTGIKFRTAKNAALLAAAPEMLEVLILTVGKCQLGYDERLIVRAKVIIEKATGN